MSTESSPNSQEIVNSEGSPTEDSRIPSNSPVLQATNSDLYPKEEVSCMNCPVAVWQLEPKSLRCYCRVLHKMVWETAKPGKIRACDLPIQLALQAAADE